MIVTTNTGRSLKVAEYGDLQGRPVLYCHGFPGSRLEAGLGDEAATENGIRLIAIDRPGMGQSTFQPKRSIHDWPADVLTVADHLGIGKFSIASVSGGSPYALACAAAIPDRLEHVGIIAGVAPREAIVAWDQFEVFNRVGLRLASWGPRTGRLLARYLRRMGSHKGTRDCAIMASSWAESFAEGPGGPGLDMTLLGSDWNIELSSITTKIKLWHGDLDIIVPSTMSAYMQTALPNAEAIYFEDEDHYSIIYNRLSSILASL